MLEIEEVIYEIEAAVKWTKQYNDDYCLDVEDAERIINKLKIGLAQCEYKKEE